MRVIRADGHRQQQWALGNIYAQTVARILSEHITDSILITAVAQTLQNCTGEMYSDLDQRSDSIRDLYQKPEIYIPVPEYISELLAALHDLYYQPRNKLYRSQEEQINSLRGAVVELLGLALIKSRYGSGDECANSRRFVDRRHVTVTLQEVDIAAISEARRELEGYECKMRAISLMHDDCVDLEQLYHVAHEEQYQAHVGIISLDPGRLIDRRLDHLHADHCIQAYGADMLHVLRYSPFDEL